MLDIFPLLLSPLCICVVCKCVVSRVLVCCFFVREHLVASFFFSGFAIGGLWSFPCFASFLFILLLMLLLSLVCTICFGRDVVSGSVLIWICDWFANILVGALKLSWRFGDCSFISFDDRVWLSISWRNRYCSPVICPLKSIDFIVGTLMLSSFVLIMPVFCFRFRGDGCCLYSRKFCRAHHLGLSNLYLVLGSRHWYSSCICLATIGLLVTLLVFVWCLLRHGE